MDNAQSLVRVDTVESMVLSLRGVRCIVDSDLARLYGVTTKALNQAVSRNLDRFPDDFLFRLTKMEKMELVTICDRFKKLKHSTSLPRAFTEYGAIMAASVLNSSSAIRTSVSVVRAFVRMREVIATGAEIAFEIADLRQRVDEHDEELDTIADAIRRLTTSRSSSARRIGFRTRDDDG